MADGTVTLGVELDEKPLHRDLDDLEKEIEATAKIIEDDLRFESEVDTKKSQDDLDNLNKKSKGASDGLDGVGESSGRAVGSVTAIGAAATVAAGGLLLVGDAADTAVGNMDRVESVFGDAKVGMEAVTAAADTLGDQLGVASQDILMAGASMAVTAENMGMGEEQAEKYGAAVAKLSAVCSSYLNIPMADAAERVSAAMRGEAEAAEALGLSLGQTAMDEFVNQQIAAGSAINKTYSEMSAEEQMVIRLVAAIDQMANTMGIATPEVYTLASAQAVLAELTSKASEEVTIQQKVTADLKETWNEFLVAIQPVKDALVGLIAVIVGLIITIGEAILTNEHFIKIFKILTVAVFANVMAIGVLISVVLLAIDAFLDWISTNEKAQEVIAAVATVVVIAAAIIAQLIVIVVEAISKFVDWIRESEELQRLLSTIADLIINICEVIGGLLTAVGNAIDCFKDWWQEAELLQGVLDGILGLIENICDAIADLIDWVNDAIDAFQDLRAQDFGSDLVNLGSSKSKSSKSSGEVSAVRGLSTSGFNMSGFVINPNAVLSGASPGTIINNTTNNWNLNFENTARSPYEIAMEVRRLNRGW